MQTIVFDVTRKESHDPQNGMKKLLRRLRGGFKVSTGKDDITDILLEELSPSCIVFGGPKEAFTDAECEAIKEYVQKGGSALFLLHEGGERNNDTNCNTVLKDMGISCNEDSVMRQVYYKYLHPKEVFVEEGVLVPDILRKKVSSSYTHAGFPSTSILNHCILEAPATNQSSTNHLPSSGN